jgi:preprotein translocase subunit SecA
VLSDAWLSEVRTTASTAIYLLDYDFEGTTAEGAVDDAALRGRVPAASVRTAISDAYGRSKPVGRNDPCPCGSGRKYKQCHLK